MSELVACSFIGTWKIEGEDWDHEHEFEQLKRLRNIYHDLPEGDVKNKMREVFEFKCECSLKPL